MKRLLLIPFLLFSVYSFLHASCPEGHQVFLPDGSTEAFFCEGISGDNLLIRSDNRGFPKVYILVDENGIILYSDTSPRIPVSSLGSGSYRIYGVVFMGRLQEVTGLHYQEARFSTFCHTISVNHIHLVIAETEISGFSYSDGSTEKEFCAIPGFDDTLQFKIDQIKGELAIVAVGEDNLILGIFNEPEVVLNDLFSGNITFHSFAYEGELNLETGDSFHPDEIIDGCFSMGSTVELIRDVPNGGRLGFEGYGAKLWLCPEDPGLSEVIFSGMDFSPLSYYVFMVNENEEIEKIFTTVQVDLSGYTGGVYSFYGASSLQPPVLAVGDTFKVATAFTTNCVDWSTRIPQLTIEDFKTGSLIAEGFPSNNLFFCLNERPDSLIIIFDDSSAPQSAVVLTNGDGKILKIEVGTNLIISASDEKELLVYGLVYSGQLLIKEGDFIGESEPSNGCYEYTEDILRIIEDKPSAERLLHGFADDSVSFCTGDGFSFFLKPETETNSLFPINYLLLDSEGELAYKFSGDSFDLEGINPGLYRLYGVSTSDFDQLIIGQPVESDSLACFDITADFLTINARRIDGGQVFFRAGRTELRLCEKQGQDYKVRIFRNSASAKYTSVLTDEENRLMLISELDSINLIGLASGNYRIWGIGHTVELDLEIGMDIFASQLSSDCFAISEKFLKLIIDNTEGGLVELGGDASGKTYCSEEVADEWLELTTSGGSALNYKFLLVDPQLRLIEALDTNWINLSDFDPGVYSIVGVSYGGNFLLQAGDLLFNPPFGVASDCHEFSSNNILINIIDITGGNISFAGGAGSKVVCPDGAASLLSFSNPPSGSYAFILTDDEGMLISFTTGLEMDVFGLDEGIYQIRGLAFLGNLVLETGIALDSQDLSSVCHDFSVNKLILNLVYPEGARVTTDLGTDDIMIEVDPLNPDTVFFENNSASLATYRYVITDVNDIVFAVMPFDFLVFNFSFFDEFRVYGISYTGNLMLGGGQLIHQTVISDDCYSLSENFVRVRLVDKVDENKKEKIEDIVSFELRLLTGNPFSTELVFEILSETGLEKVNYFYQLFDIHGRLYREGRVDNLKGLKTVHLTSDGLTSGMYILRVTNGVNSKELKLIRN